MYMSMIICNKNHPKMTNIAGDTVDLLWIHMGLTSYVKIIITISFKKQMNSKKA